MHLAEHNLKMKVVEKEIPVTSLGEFVEAGACGTAAVITPIGSITHEGKKYAFYGEGKEVGPKIKELYSLLTSIQTGDIKGPDGWVVEVK